MRIDNSYCDFVPYLYQNEIVLVKNVSKGWDLQASTVLANENLRDIEVPVDEPGKDRRTMRLAEFFELARTSTVHLKDWHLDRVGELGSMYSVPVPFQDDWLNFYWQVVSPQFSDSAGAPEDDYSFCYVGSNGTKTALHHDVVLSYSWSVSLCGKKKWTLWRPGEEGNGKDAALEVTQTPGDAIFVPSGWHHQVDNEVDPLTGFTVSINRNWLNGFNLFHVCSFLLKEHRLVCEELRHLFEPTSEQDNETTIFSSYQSRDSPLMGASEWHQHCDVILRANAAFSLKMLLRLLTARVLLMATASGVTGPTYASSVFCVSEYSPLPSADEQELFRCQKVLQTPAPGGATVWNHTLQQVQCVVHSLHDADTCAQALPFIFHCDIDALHAALDDIVQVCQDLKD